jgi:outer membrane protein OmpA-like peptidoglycan-associated protein
MSFHLYSAEPAPAGAQARLRSYPPVWKHNTGARELGSAPLRAQREAMLLHNTLASRILTELEQGMFPAIHYTDHGSAQDDVVVKLSAVNFMASLREYRECVAQLTAYDYAAVSRMTVYFGSGANRLSERARHKLDSVADYLLNDADITLAVIEGHSDAAGRRADNFELSKQRADAVQRYLLGKKVPADKLKVRFFGQRKPAASNKSAAGRAQNRRVQLRLIK